MAVYVYDKLKKLVGTLTTAEKYIDDKNFEQIRHRIQNLYADIMLCIAEGYYQNSNSSALMVLKQLLTMQEVPLWSVENAENLRAIVSVILTPLSDENLINELVRTRYNNYKDRINAYTGAIQNTVTNERFMNVLFYDAPNAIIESKIASKERIHSYGICIKERAHVLLENVAYGAGDKSRISNGVFDTLVIMPESNIYYEPFPHSELLPRPEYTCISSTLKFLRTHGMIQLIMPFFRIDQDIAALIARNFTDLKIFFIDNIFVEIRGTKQSEKILDNAVYTRLRLLFKEIRDISHPVPGPYTLPYDLLPIDSFRGAKVTDEMLDKLLSESTAFKDILKLQNANNNDALHSPALPLDSNKIGLTLASGRANGIVFEDSKDPSKCHLVKGRIKECLRTEEGEEYMYHSVEINALVPTGELITING